MDGDIPAISEGAPQLTDMSVGLLYVDDFEHDCARTKSYSEPENDGDEEAAEPLPRPG